MAKEFGRSQRVAAQIQKELAEILQREVRDRRIGLVTINEVVLSKDLAVAKIYVTVMNADQTQKAANVSVLNDMTPFVRHELAKRMRLRHVPELHFVYDDSFDTGMRVSEILHEVLPTTHDDSEANG